VKVFVAHSATDAPIAQALATKLRTRRMEVFLDRDSLPPGREFDERIRAAIRSADLFVFLLSPASTTPGCYALTELGIARERWPNPDGKVLAVMVSPTDLKAVDPYLTASGTVLKPAGDVVVEAAHAAQVLLQVPRKRRLRLAAITTGALGAVALLAWIVVPGSEPSGPPRPMDAESPVAPISPPAASLEGVFSLRCQCGNTTAFCAGFVVADGWALTHTRCAQCPDPSAGASCQYSIVEGAATGCSRVEVDPRRPGNADHKLALLRLDACQRALAPVTWSVPPAVGSRVHIYGNLGGTFTGGLTARLESDSEGQILLDQLQVADEHAEGGPIVGEGQRVFGIVQGQELRPERLTGVDATVVRDQLRELGIQIRWAP
jgi:hypothetical protein